LILAGMDIARIARIGISRPKFFLFEQLSLLGHRAPMAGQIEVRSSKHVIGYLSGITPALIGPLPTFVSTVHGREAPKKCRTGHLPVPSKSLALAFGNNRWRGFALADVLRAASDA
jgi:hypothetical protein